MNVLYMFESLFCLNRQFLLTAAVWNILMAVLGAGSAPTLRGFRGPATLAGMVGCCCGRIRIIFMRILF